MKTLKIYPRNVQNGSEIFEDETDGSNMPTERISISKRFIYDNGSYTTCNLDRENAKSYFAVNRTIETTIERQNAKKLITEVSHLYVEGKVDEAVITIERLAIHGI